MTDYDALLNAARVIVDTALIMSPEDDMEPEDLWVDPRYAVGFELGVISYGSAASVEGCSLDRVTLLTVAQAALIETLSGEGRTLDEIRDVWAEEVFQTGLSTGLSAASLVLGDLR